VPGFKVHINNAEGMHARVKTMLRRSDNRWGKTLESCEQKAAFLTYMVSVEPKDRFQEVMKVLAKHANNPVCHYEPPVQEEEGDFDENGSSASEQEDEPIVCDTPLRRAQHEHILWGR